MAGVAARTEGVRDHGGIKEHLRPSSVHPITAAMWLALILASITATIHIVPSLLQPLFGSIPVSLHKDSTIHALFALSAVTLVSWPQALDLDMAILAGFSGLDLVIVATAYKTAARLGGDWFGAISGATWALTALCLGPILLGATVWSRTIKSVWTSKGTTRTGRQIRVFVLATIGLLWLGVQLALLCTRSQAGSDLISRLVKIFRPEVQHPLFIIIGLAGLWLVQSWVEAQRTRPGNPFNPTLQLLTLFLIGNITLSLVKPRAFPYTVALPLNHTSPAGAPKDRPAPGVRILNSTRSITGQIVVAENMEYGYRFLRCDHSLLGGRWAREGKDGQTEFGDSIFSTFVLQDAAKLVYRSEPYLHKAKLSAEIIGLGVGIAAHSLMIDGVSVRITEIDPAVYEAAHQYFGLPAPARLELDDGAKVIEDRATAIRTSGRSLHPREQTDYVIHDCFTGGSVPAELFTREFWWDLTMSMKTDGVLVVNFAGILRSRASQAVFATLLDVFPQCRAFQDVHGIPENATGKELINMVIFCTMIHSPLLTFRMPEPRDLGYSPLRQEVLTTFLPYEISIADQLGSSIWQSFWIDDVGGNNDRTEHEDQDENDDNGEGEYYRPHPNPNNMPETIGRGHERDLILRRGHGMDQLDKWQVDSAVATWTAMRAIMPVEGWLAY